jgi:hypothetical protein
MSSLHLASEDQLMFVGELLTVIHRIQTSSSDDATSARDWLSHVVDALADLASCHDELQSFELSLRSLARKEGGQGVEDTDAEDIRFATTPTRLASRPQAAA